MQDDREAARRPGGRRGSEGEKDAAGPDGSGPAPVRRRRGGRAIGRGRTGRDGRPIEAARPPVWAVRPGGQWIGARLCGRFFGGSGASPERGGGGARLRCRGRHVHGASGLTPLPNARPFVWFRIL